MNIADGIQLVLVALTLASIGFGLVNRWAVANHRDRLAMFTAAAGNAAGGIRLAMAALPPGADVATMRSILVQNASSALLKEFDTTAEKIGATPAKAAKLISDQLVPPAAVSVVLSVPSAALALVSGVGALGAELTGAAPDAERQSEAAAAPVVKALGTL